jgi:hypothetical protein
MSAVSWLAFTPAYHSPRGAQRARLGAHAFRDNALRSICGYVERARAGVAATAQDRHCRWCECAADGRSKDLSESTTPTGWSP